MEDVSGKNGQKRHVGHSPQAHGRHNGQKIKNDPIGPHIPHPLDDALPDRTRGPLSGHSMRELDPRECHNDRQKTEGVQVKASGNSDFAQSQTGSGRPNDSGEIELDRVQGNGVHQIISTDEVLHHRLIGRHAQRIGDPRQQGQHKHMPYGDDARRHQQSQNESKHHEGRLRRHEQPSPIKPIRVHASDE